VASIEHLKVRKFQFQVGVCPPPDPSTRVSVVCILLH